MRSPEPPGVQAMVKQGVTAARRGKWNEAVRWFDEALARTPPLTPAQRSITLHHRGLAKARLRQLDGAVEDFSHAIQINDEFGLAYIDRGVARAQRGEFRRALVDLSKGLALVPDQLCGLVARGLVHFELGALENALADLTAAQQLAVNDADIYFHRGKVQLTRANYSAAAADFDDSVRLSPHHPRYHNQLAWFCSTCPDERHRNAAKAVTHAATACELSGWSDYVILDTLAAALAASGEFVHAIEKLELALALAPETERALLRRHLDALHTRKPYHEMPP